MIDSFIFLVSQAVDVAVNIHDIDAYQKDLKNDYIIMKELSGLAGALVLNCGRFLAVANAALITTKHMPFANPEGSPVIAPDTPVAEQSSPITEQSKE